MRMQLKLTMVFLFISLLTLGTVGGTAFYLVERDFSLTSQANAFGQFQKDLQAYIVTYDTFQNAFQSEPFDAFVRRKHAEAAPDEVQHSVVAPLQDRWNAPPFLFLVVNLDGEVLMPAAGLKKGDKVKQEVIDQATPIMVNGRKVALASPVGTPVLTPQDQNYLNAVQKALLIGGGAALFIALILSLLFGRTMTRAMRALTKAIRKMKENKEEFFAVEVTSSDELGELSEAYNAMSRELAQTHRELLALAVEDPLTGLYNRRHFSEQARQFFASAKRYKQPLSVMIGDLDNFKDINDNFGHDTGDLILEKVAEIFRLNTRKSDIIARYGGEEFVVLFAHTDGPHASIACENIRMGIESFLWRDFHPDLKLTISIGLCGDMELGSVRAMLTKADQFLYAAKASGRNKVVCDGQDVPKTE